MSTYEIQLVGVEITARRSNGDVVHVTVYPTPYGFKCHDKDGISVNDPLCDALSLRNSTVKAAVDSFADDFALLKGKR